MVTSEMPSVIVDTCDEYFDGLVQECSISNELEMEIPQPCIGPSIGVSYLMDQRNDYDES